MKDQRSNNIVPSSAQAITPASEYLIHRGLALSEQLSSQEGLLTQLPPALSLRGFFTLPDMLAQGLICRMGKGALHSAVCIAPDKLLLVSRSGARLLDIGTNETQWEIDCPTSRSILSPTGAVLGLDKHLWNLRTGRLILSLRDLEGPIAFSPDERLLAVPSLLRVDPPEEERGQAFYTRKGEKVVWRFAIDLLNADTGSHVCSLDGHRYYVSALRFSVDGRFLASAGEEFIRIWNIAEAREHLSLRLVHAATRVDFSRSGKLLVAGNGKRVEVCETITGRGLLSVEAERFALASLADSIALARQNKVLFWRQELGSISDCMTLHTLQEGDIVHSLMFSDDDKNLAIATQSGKLILIRMEETNFNTSVDNSGIVKIDSILNNNNEIVISGVGFGQIDAKEKTMTNDRLDDFKFSDAHIWDVVSQKQIYSTGVYGHLNGIERLVFSQDGQIIASSSTDGWIGIWSVADSKPLFFRKWTASPIGDIAFSEDGRLLFSMDKQNGVVEMDLHSGHILRQYTLQGQSEIITPMCLNLEKSLAAGKVLGGDACLWSVKSGNLMHRWKADSLGIWSIAISPDGLMVATGEEVWHRSASKAALRLWDTRSGRLLVNYSFGSGGAVSVTFSYASDRVAASDCNGKVIILELGTGRVSTILDQPRFKNQLVFDKSGRLLACHHIFDTQTGDFVFDNPIGEMSIAFSPDSRRFATGGHEGVVRLWQLDNSAITQE